MFLAIAAEDCELKFVLNNLSAMAEFPLTARISELQCCNNKAAIKVCLCIRTS